MDQAKIIQVRNQLIEKLMRLTKYDHAQVKGTKCG